MIKSFFYYFIYNFGCSDQTDMRTSTNLRVTRNTLLIMYTTIGEIFCYGFVTLRRFEVVIIGEHTQDWTS